MIEGSVAFFGKSAGSDSHLIQRDEMCTIVTIHLLFNSVFYTRYNQHYISVSYHYTSHNTRFKPAELGVDVLEGGGEDAADVGHVEVHQGDPDQGVQHRRDLPQRSFCRQVSVTFVRSGQV